MKVLVLSVGTLLMLTPLVQALGQTSGTVPQVEGVPYSDYGLSALSSGDGITANTLGSSTGNNLTVAGLEGYIEHNLAPYDIRQVLLDIGWQNYAAGTIPREDWVNNWLTACDVMGIQNVIYVGQLTTDGVGSPWIMSVISMDPSAQTYSSKGSAVAFISYDSPDVLVFLEKDLSTLYSYYGSYPSWIGIGTGSSANDPYYTSGHLFPGLGYSNLSISSFVNSEYYSSDVNATAILPNGQTNPLWASYGNVQPSVLLSSGLWITSSAANVYGNGSLSNFVEMRFKLPVNASSFGVSWYGNKVGSPGPMVVKLNADANGSLDSSRQLAVYEVSASSFTNGTGWQSDPSVEINMTSGYYWVTFSSPSSSSEDYYQVFIKNSLINDGIAYAQESYVGPGFQHGSTILWLKDNLGRTMSLYPYQQAIVSNPDTQEFVATNSFSFSTIFLFLVDRIYNPTNGTITLTDMSEGGKTLATGILSQQLVHGLEGWVPISLNATITTIPGHVYVMSITEPNGGYSWTVVVRGESTDPSSAGFQGQSSYWLFQLANLNWVQGHLDFIDMTTNGMDAVTSGYMDAVRFMPSSNEILESVSILMASNSQSGNYTSGTLSVSIWYSDPSGLTPSTPLPRQVTIPAREIPANGFLRATGFNQSVIGGRYYWIVFSANSNESFSMSRLTSTYAFDVLVSKDGGAEWQEPREGPTEFAFVVSLSNQEVGNFISGKPSIQIGASGYFAEPFYSDETAQVTGVYLGELTAGPLLSVSINPDAGAGHPSLSPIASGVFNTINVTLAGPQFVQLTSVASLKAGQEYWLVIHPLQGSYKLSPLVYLPGAPNAPSNLPSVVSEDGGLTWEKTSNSTSMLTYQLASPAVEVPQSNTSTLANYLSTYQSPSVLEGPIHGWTGYIASSELSMFGQVTRWLGNETGRDFLFFGHGQPNVLNQLAVKNQILLTASASGGSCSALANELTAEMPIANAQYYNVADSNLLAGCEGTSLESILQQLGYMLGTGQDYGHSSETKVLVVGDTVSENLTRYLSVAYNATYSQLSLDPDLRDQGNLSGYGVIVWASNENPFLSTLNSRLTKYVKAGGMLVLTQFGGNNSALSSLSASLPYSNSSLPVPGTAYLMALVAHTSYTDLSVNASSSEIRGDSPDVSITIHTYGDGTLYTVWFSAAQANQVSEPVVLLSNIIAESDRFPDPFWYGVGSSLPDSSVEYSVSRTGSGPILVWVANTGGENVTFSLNLNGSYYGVSSSWKALNLNDMSVMAGSGSDLVVGGNLAAKSWLPTFIVRDSSAALIDYANVQVNGQFVYPNQSFYRLAGVRGQDALLLLASNTTAAQLLVNDNLSLPNLQSVDVFAKASSGWVYYNDSGTLMVKFATNGASTLRLLAYTGPSKGQVVLPTSTLLTVIVVLVCSEIIVFALTVFTRQRKQVLR